MHIQAIIDKQNKIAPALRRLLLLESFAILMNEPQYKRNMTTRLIRLIQETVIKMLCSRARCHSRPWFTDMQL